MECAADAGFPGAADAFTGPLRERVDVFRRERKGKLWAGGHVLHGARPGPDAVLVNSNDYLCLARDPVVVEAMARTLAERGNDTLMSGVLLHGDDQPQLALETDLARFMGARSGILCQSGWEANAGLLATIVTEGTPVYVDTLAHMSLWEGARAAGGALRRFRHNDPGHLRRRIDTYGPGLVLVDSLYSTDGSVCPLAETAAVAGAAGCVMVVDESHAVGVWGDGGAGLWPGAAGPGSEAVWFRTASLSKAFAGRAGFIACEGPVEAELPDFVEYFKITAPPAVFSSTLLPHDVAGLRAAMDIVRVADDRRARLRDVSAYVRGELERIGPPLYVGGSGGQIVSLEAGDEAETIVLRDALEGRGVFGAPFVPPATRRKGCVVRISLHAGLTDAEVERVVAACVAARQSLPCQL
ncbi:alpha-hydroxyketone-type quorum-sensing autoinducer synthase [Streptomyces fractus]|uniref:alpha-hydroxyketone-type quorum-sensing autoinducer synthase n=1 Tax=Streptomyces fractus TaxID=641806 RepID=UPI003CE97F51